MVGQYGSSEGRREDYPYLGKVSEFEAFLQVCKYSFKNFLLKADMKAIPIWVKFPNLKLSCRSVNILSKISCCIGNPICMDKFTSTGQGLAFARVLVEVSTDSNLPDSIIIGCKENTLEQAVEYV
eukprot:TRINITY_DN8877_c0_g1_i1.p1 TRINITY_DN8877_c0_g1~~TRINITY_DN8877_c0_g1_i1.p1  ORF type:complete len:125 (+),score=18.82 TRINITY_DN8877_c0_g1_i1:317-691(+)